MSRVGIPRALSYYRYFPLWKTLLEGLGAEVVLSRKTGRHLLEDGVRHCVDDICVPVKLYYGHVLDLADSVDYIFISRLVSIEKSDTGDTYTCPKLIGLPDMIKSSLTGLPPLIEFVVDIQNRSFKKSVKSLGDALGASAAAVKGALASSLEVQRRYDTALLAGFEPEIAMKKVLGGGNGGGVRAGPPAASSGTAIRVALVGHEYLIHDTFMSHDLGRKLEKQGAQVTLMTEVPPDRIEAELARYPGISWSYEKELLGATSYFLNRPDIDGVMFVMGFACGPDSIISEIITREVRTPESPPLMALVLDEHTGEAGVATRVEAFVDLIKRSRRSG